jgi:hypothetical protein
MKNLLAFEKEISEAGGKVGGAVGIEGENLKVEVSASYPLSKVIEPATKALDSALDKFEKLIPGDWDKGPIEKIKAEYKEELVKLLAE